MVSSQSEVVLRSIDSNVLGVSFSEELHGFKDSVITTILSSRFEGEVSVATRTVPITLNRLRLEGDINVVFFTNPFQDISSNPELVTSLESFNGSNLEFPLSGEDFGVETGDLDTSSKAAPHMGFSNISTNSVGRSY